jgi:hypothetical protein
MSDPLPKELVMDAWKAKVGYSLDRARTHAAWNDSISDIVPQ